MSTYTKTYKQEVVASRAVVASNHPLASVAGGMNGVLLDSAGLLHGTACWRSDGVPIGVSGGTARPSGSLGVPT